MDADLNAKEALTLPLSESQTSITYYAKTNVKDKWNRLWTIKLKIHNLVINDFYQEVPFSGLTKKRKKLH